MVEEVKNEMMFDSTDQAQESKSEVYKSYMSEHKAYSRQIDLPDRSNLSRNNTSTEK